MKGRESNVAGGYDLNYNTAEELRANVALHRHPWGGALWNQ